MLTSGPTRLLAYHACELYLKAYLREHGQEVKRLTRYRHDLDAMLAAAVAEGLCPGPRIEARLRRATTRKDYVRVRYMVVERGSDISSEDVLELTDGVRHCVRTALGYNELGMPVAGEVEPSGSRRTRIDSAPQRTAIAGAGLRSRPSPPQKERALGDRLWPKPDAGCGRLRTYWVTGTLM